MKSSHYLFVKICDKTDSETYSVIVDTDTFDVGFSSRGVSLLVKVGTEKQLKLTEVVEIPLFSFAVLNNKTTGLNLLKIRIGILLLNSSTFTYAFDRHVFHKPTSSNGWLFTSVNFWLNKCSQCTSLRQWKCSEFEIRFQVFTLIISWKFRITYLVQWSSVSLLLVLMPYQTNVFTACNTQIVVIVSQLLGYYSISVTEILAGIRQSGCYRRSKNRPFTLVEDYYCVVTFNLNFCKRISVKLKYVFFF